MMTLSSKKLIIVVAAVAIIVAGAALLPMFVRAHNTSASNACVNNLRNIQAAKEQWATENRKTTNDVPTWDAIRPYLGRGSEGEIPKCLDGGTYTLGRVGEPPKCSLGPAFVGGKSHEFSE